MPDTTGVAHESLSTQIVLPVMFSPISNSVSRSSVRAVAGDDALEDLRRPRRAFAALRALRAALVREEARGARDLLHEILRVVDDDHAAGAEHRALRDEALVVHEARFGLFDASESAPRCRPG